MTTLTTIQQRDRQMRRARMNRSSYRSAEGHLTAQDIRRAAEDLAQSFTEHRNTRDDLGKGGEAAAIARYWQEVYEAEYDKAEPIIEAIGKRWWTIYMLAEGRYWQMTGKPAAIISLVMPWRRLLSAEKEAAAA